MRSLFYLLAMLVSIGLFGSGCDDNTKRAPNIEVGDGSRDMDVPIGGMEMMDMMVSNPINARELIKCKQYCFCCLFRLVVQ